MILSIIVAIAKNFAIGKNNQLLYHLADDMKRFKEITSNHTVIMGKNTFMSLPKRPLANRRNIVLALPNEMPDDKEGAEWVSSLNEAFDKCKNDDEVFVIGGASVYAQAYPLADKIYLTIVDDDPQEADAFFPIINFNEWNNSDYKTFLPNEKNEKGFVFITLSRKEKINHSIPVTNINEAFCFGYRKAYQEIIEIIENGIKQNKNIESIVEKIKTKVF